jgi:hypothetical protein
MKKLFAPAWITAWTAGVLPDSIFFLGKKTPWYRQSWMANMPWIAVALATPLALFLLWKGASIMWLKLAPAGGDSNEG